MEKSIALAYLPTAHLELGTELEVTIVGERRAARVVEQPLYDPTNARLLDRHAANLARAGLRRVNISLDSLEPERFARLTRGEHLSEVLAGPVPQSDGVDNQRSRAVSAGEGDLPLPRPAFGAAHLVERLGHRQQG